MSVYRTIGPLVQNLTFVKHYKKKMTMSSFCNPKVVKSAAKFLKIVSLVKLLYPKIILNSSFACAREVIHTPEN